LHPIFARGSSAALTIATLDDVMEYRLAHRCCPSVCFGAGWSLASISEKLLDVSEQAGCFMTALETTALPRRND
jgi:hypothetical protein